MAPYAEYWLNPLKAAAPSFGVEPILAPVRDKSELESVIAAQAREANSGLFVMPDTFTIANRVEITSLAARYRLPAVYAFRFFTELGGLLSYGNDRNDNFRRAASYADRILKGENPSELPVQAPVKYELVINRKTAKALGLTDSCTAAKKACFAPLHSITSSAVAINDEGIAQSGHPDTWNQCPLLGVKRTSR
jgi:putative ABC transport system substrate-binding protein